jgi:hypothetical protein
MFIRDLIQYAGDLIWSLICAHKWVIAFLSLFSGYLFLMGKIVLWAKSMGL